MAKRSTNGMAVCADRADGGFRKHEAHPAVIVVQVSSTMGTRTTMDTWIERI